MDPSLCSNGCGFFCSPEKQNMCSKCYRDHNITKMIMNFRNIASSSSSSKYDERLQQKKRCKSCNKRIKVTGFRCRCGDLFCGKHRYPEEHSCSVDYKKIGRELIRKQNPICKAHKLFKV